MKDFKNILLTQEDKVAILKINRPEKANALDVLTWQELKEAMECCAETPGIRAIVLAGEGEKLFSAGIDLSVLMSLKVTAENECEGRTRENIRNFILQYHQIINLLETCRKPVLAAVHGACIGAGLDLICAADMRYCTSDAYFCIKEIDMGMVADFGTLQRLPKLISDGLCRELAYTGRKMYAEEAEKSGLVNKVFQDKNMLLEEVLKIARNIAEKSPLSVRGTKENILYARDHSVADGLNFVATWNAGMILSNDLNEALKAQMAKTVPQFKD
ncbi:crotonase/enoyl-CoA hydratase family protein [Pseudarcicella hirudinis]|nr:crotonase/enoyl-CoA hydratase family protein [Pseudarcicella hirudinis]